MKSTTVFTFTVMLLLCAYTLMASSMHLTGKIGNSPVQMDLTINDNNTVSGNYIYEKVFEEITLEGTFSKKENRIRISEDVSGGTMELYYDSSGAMGFCSYKGIWKNKSRRFDVNLKVVSFYHTIQLQEQCPAGYWDLAYTFPRFLSFTPHYKELNELMGKELTDFLNETEMENASTGISNRILYIDTSMVLLESSGDYSAEGAAHPLGGTSVAVIMINGEHVHTAELTDIIQNKYIDTVVALLNSEMDSGDFGAFEKENRSHEGALSNFLPTPKGLIFYYNIYEAGPYAGGGFKILLPWKRLAPYLKTDNPLPPLFSPHRN